MSTTVTFKPTANTDTNHWGPDFYSGNITDFSNMGQPTAFEWHSSLRFPDVTVPYGAMIISAKITLDAYGADSSDDVNVKIYGNDVDDAVAPTSFAEAQGLDLTTAYASWSKIAAWTTGTDYDTPDLTTVVKEIVDRTGWASGQAMQFVIRNNASTVFAGRQYSNFKKGVDYCPILTITYNTFIINAEPIEVTSSIESTSAEPTDWNVLIAPVTNITSSVGLQDIYGVHLLGYVYEEVDDNGTQIDPVLFTNEGVGKNILQRKNAKYLYYEIDTGGNDVTVTFYVDGTAQSTTKTLNKNGRTRDRLDLPNFEGYRFSIRLTCSGRRDTKPVIYQPWAIQYTPYGV